MIIYKLCRTSKIVIATAVRVQLWKHISCRDCHDSEYINCFIFKNTKTILIWTNLHIQFLAYKSIKYSTHKLCNFGHQRSTACYYSTNTSTKRLVKFFKAKRVQNTLMIKFPPNEEEIESFNLTFIHQDNNQHK